MNTRKGELKFKIFRILLDSGFSSTVVMGRLMSKLTPKKGDIMQCHTQADKITTNLRVKIEFTLPELSATNVVMWNFHVDDSVKGIYDMILGRDILTSLGLNLKFSYHVIEAGDGTFKGSTSPMVYLGEYEFKDLETGKITPEGLFMKAYT